MGLVCLKGTGLGHQKLTFPRENDDNKWLYDSYYFLTFCFYCLGRFFGVCSLSIECCKESHSISGIGLLSVAKDLAVCKNLVNMAKRSCSASESSIHPAPNTACTRLVGVAAFSSSFFGFKLVPAK